MTTGRVLIAGCGDLGTEVGLRLADRGHEVFGARRSPEVLPPGITGLRSDLEGELGDLPERLDLVVFTPAAGGRGAAGYAAVYRDGLDRLLRRLEDEGQQPRRVLFVSATSVYGVADGSEVAEDTPAIPSRDTGQVLVEAEQVLARSPFPGTSLRLAGIYGPGRTGLIDRVRDGSERLPVGDHPTNRIHRDDAAAAIVHLLTAVDDPAEAYIGVDHEAAQKADVIRFLAGELGVPVPGTDDASGGARRRSGAKRCVGDRLRATGFQFTYPTYREGYRAVLAGEGVRHP